MRYFWFQKPRLLVLACLVLLGIGISLVNPQIIGYFLDLSQSSDSLNQVFLAATLFIAFTIIQQLINLATRVVSGKVSWSATNRLRSDLTNHCLRLDMDFHKQHTPGEMIERLDGDVSLLGNYFADFSIQLVGNGLLVLGILIVLFFNNAWVGMVMLVYVLLTLLVLGVIQKPAVRFNNTARQATAEQYGYIEERISGVEELRAAGAEDYAIYRLLQIMREFLEKWRRAIMVGTLTSNLTLVLTGVGYALGLALGVIFYQSGSATIGTVYTFIFYIGLLTAPLQAIRAQVQDFQQASVSLQRVEGLLNQVPKVADPVMAPVASRGERFLTTSGLRPDYELRPDYGFHPEPGFHPDKGLQLDVEHITFRYEDNPESAIGDGVLTDISFLLSPGQTLGILGRTGSGKSTLTRLLTRLYDPQQGSIRINEVDLKDIPIERLRQRIGMVTQDVQLFDGTIRENLTLFDRDFDDHSIKSVLKTVGFSEWLTNLPEGLETRLAAGGQGLSAGEAQLLAFARIFLRDPGLVILDEASSRLDLATERKMELAVGELLSGRTGILIAHRLKTLEKLDTVLILEAGRAVEFGRRLELASDQNSLYTHLLRTGLEEVLA